MSDPANSPETTEEVEAPTVDSMARKLLEGRIGVHKGCPCAPLALWINLAEQVYPADHPILRELTKSLV